jgi:hypothetical protein
LAGIGRRKPLDVVMNRSGEKISALVLHQDLLHAALFRVGKEADPVRRPRRLGAWRRGGLVRQSAEWSVRLIWTGHA